MVTNNNLLPLEPNTNNNSIIKVNQKISLGVEPDLVQISAHKTQVNKITVVVICLGTLTLAEG